MIDAATKLKKIVVQGKCLFEVHRYKEAATLFESELLKFQDSAILLLNLSFVYYAIAVEKIVISE